MNAFPENESFRCETLSKKVLDSREDGGGGGGKGGPEVSEYQNLWGK